MKQDTNRKKITDKENKRLIAAVEGFGEGILITDKKGRIRYLNSAVEKNSGYTKKELLGKPPDLFFAETSGKNITRRIFRNLDREGKWRGRLTKKNKSGGVREVEVSASVIRDDKGNVSDYVIIERDITRMIKYEKRLRQSQKMESLGTMASGIAHDLNNIFMPIIINSELARLELSEDGKIDKYLDQIIEAANKGKDMVNRIVTFSKSKGETKKPVNLVNVIQNALDMFLSASHPKIKIIKNIPSKIEPFVLADPVQIEQVVLNILWNAAEAMEEKGTIIMDLKSSVTEMVPPDQGPDNIEGDYFILSVTDTGCGIEPRIMDNIFDPFFTTRKKKRGSGMGLAVSHGIMTSHKGEIQVNSEPGSGTTFSLFFPATSRRNEEITKEPEALPQGEERILLIDDDSANTDAVRRMLERLGYRIHVENDSRRALQVFSERPDSFDLVVTDQRMPGLQGTELAEKIRRVRNGIPVIIITGFSQTVQDDRIKSLNIQEVLFKPLGMKEIARSVRRVLDGLPQNPGQKGTASE